MRLVEDGKISLDTKVLSILPNFKVADPEVTAAVTIKHLLTHSAGWTGDFFIETGSDDDASRKFVERMVELEQLTQLGAVHSYSNSCFCLLGYIIEVLTGEAFPKVVKDFILLPLGMKHTAFDLADLPTAAVGHLNQNCKLMTFTLPPVPRAALASGGFNAFTFFVPERNFGAVILTNSETG